MTTWTSGGGNIAAGGLRSQWITLDAQQISYYKSVADYDPPNVSAREFVIRKMLAGGMKMQMGGDEEEEDEAEADDEEDDEDGGEESGGGDKEKKKKKKDDEDDDGEQAEEEKEKEKDIHDSEFQHKAWTEWMPEGATWAFAVGFIATQFIPDRKHEWIPRCLDLTRVQVQYYLDENTHRHHFRYLIYPDCTTDSERLQRISTCRHNEKNGFTDTDKDLPPGAVEIPNVMTVYFQPPTPDGNIRSLVAMGMPDFHTERHLFECAMLADSGRAQPFLITQHPEKINANSMTTITPSVSGTAGQGPQAQFQGSGGVPHPFEGRSGTSAFTHAQDTPDREVIRMLNGAINGGRLNRNQAESSAEDLAARYGLNLNGSNSGNNAGVPQIDLQDGRELVNQNMPEPPSVSPVDFREMRRQRVFEMYGIPVSMVDGSGGGGKSSGGNSKKSTAAGSSSSAGGGGGGQSSSSSSSSGAAENVLLTFLENQKSIQKKFASWIEAMYQQFYFKGNLARELEGRKRKRDDGSEDASGAGNPQKKGTGPSKDGGGGGGSGGRTDGGGVHKRDKKRKRPGEDEEEGEHNGDVDGSSHGDDEEEEEWGDLSEKLKMKVVFPFIPNPSVIKELYMDGWLKDWACRKMIASTWNLPLVYLNRKPKPPGFTQEQELQDQSNKAEKQLQKQNNQAKSQQIEMQGEQKAEQDKSKKRKTASST
jgi:hypothetical protein